MAKRSQGKKFRKNRRLVLQALYQWHINKQPSSEIQQQFQQEHSEENIDWAMFSDYLRNIIARIGQIDSLIEPLLDRKLDELDSVELSLLRMSTYELQEQPNIAYEVIINESIELARLFGASDSYKFINAILDRLCGILPLRKAEKESRASAEK